ncbi:diacylglycerol kinase [Synergistales bacterium]|nr:diacylglycerol kinase [Synergistales bacterium]
MKRYSVLTRLYMGTRYSVSGLICALKQEQAFEFEAIALMILCAVLLCLRPGFLIFTALVGAWMLVMALELVNSAVERAFDLIDMKFHPQIKAGKDMLSAAVFLMISFNVFLWCLFLLWFVR